MSVCYIYDALYISTYILRDRIQIKGYINCNSIYYFILFNNNREFTRIILILSHRVLTFKYKTVK